MITRGLNPIRKVFWDGVGVLDAIRLELKEERKLLELVTTPPDDEQIAADLQRLFAEGIATELGVEF